MPVIELNEYRVDFVDNHSEVFMARNVREVAAAKETPGDTVAQVTCVKRNVGVATPIRNVKFNVTTLPEAAEENGCHAAPETWVVPEGTRVIFTAMAAPGFRFDGWYLGGTLLSADAVAELQVDYPPDPGALAAELEARFSPIS